MIIKQQKLFWCKFTPPKGTIHPISILSDFALSKNVDVLSISSMICKKRCVPTLKSGFIC